LIKATVPAASFAARDTPVITAHTDKKKPANALTAKQLLLSLASGKTIKKISALKKVELRTSNIGHLNLS
jgi:hypothetical protein